MLKRKIVYLFFFCVTITSSAQDSFDSIDTLVMLNEVSINSYRFDQFSEGSKHQQIDSLSKSNHFSSSLAEALNSLSTLYLKSYGYNGNTTVSLRGTTAAQTAILWNGINLQDPLNGGTNLELIPLQVIDKISIQYGGSGALYGSGAIGGAILMESKATFSSGQKAAIELGTGSFGSYSAYAAIHNGGKKIASSIRIFYRQAENDFPFINTQQFGHPKMKLSNSASEYIGLSQDSRFWIAKNQQINTHLWLQRTNRELPPNMSALVSKQSQKDDVLRFTADYTLTKTKMDWMLRAAFLSSKLNFNDSLSGVFAEHKSQSAILETEVNYKTRDNHLANLGIHERIDWGVSSNIANKSQRNNLALLLNYKIWTPDKSLQFSTSLRQELIDNAWSEPTPTIGFNYHFKNHFQLSGKIARNYRQPTFNDLFWQGGFAKGNPDLHAETAWAEDLAIQYFRSENLNSYNFSITAFNSYVKNLILWIPVEGIWMPMNQKEVWARGLEVDFKFHRKTDKARLGLEIHYSYNPSTIEKKAENESSEILKKQLIYTPKQQAKALLTLEYKKYQSSIEQLFVGKRYTVADNSSWLKSYGLTNIILKKSFSKNNYDYGIGFRLNNLFNQKYQSMRSYVLPGRNFQLNIYFNFI